MLLEERHIGPLAGEVTGLALADIGCGTGRHAVRLARRGASVLGVDITAAYLREARRAAKKLPNVRFVRGDMRR